MAEKNQQLGALESILFVTGEPLTLQKISQTLELSVEEVRGLLDVLAEKYTQDPVSGLMLLFHKEAVRLATKPAFSKILEDLTKKSLQENLSKAALEVLAIIAYRAPISRAEIETIRGVNCSFTLRNLLMRELIEREGNPEDLRGYLYAPSFRFLESLGIAKREDLPDYETLSQDERVKALVETEELPSILPEDAPDTLSKEA